MAQLTALHRVTELTPKGGKVGRYRSSRADHFFFCECYDLLAHRVRSGEVAGGWSDPPPSIGEQVRSRGVFGRGPLRGWF